jgi:hypothetical protein
VAKGGPGPLSPGGSRTISLNSAGVKDDPKRQRVMAENGSTAVG